MRQNQTSRLEAMSPCFARILSVFLLVVGVGLEVGLMAGSLWREPITDEKGMFADRRARRLGDIVTIVVDETTVQENLLNLQTERKTVENGFLSNLVRGLVTGVARDATGSDTKIQNGKSLAQRFGLGSSAQTNAMLSGGFAPNQDTSNRNNQILQQNRQVLQSRMAVQVIDVLPNGNLVIEGLKQISFAQEKQFASVRGIIRPFDITFQNTIKTDQVADVRVDVLAEGQLSDAQKRGWLSRLDDKIRPY